MIVGVTTAGRTPPAKPNSASCAAPCCVSLIGVGPPAGRVPVAKDLQLAAMATAAAAWVNWQGGRPVEYRVRRPGQALPAREELGDLNESQWEVGPDARPRDPWQNCRFVHLIHPQTAAAFTYSTSSYGGRDAVTTLADQIGRMRLAHPAAVPLVELGAAEMPTKYGIKSRPIFKVIRWSISGASTNYSACRKPASPRGSKISILSRQAGAMNSTTRFHIRGGRDEFSRQHNQALSHQP
jgi:hypothetical protein